MNPNLPIPNQDGGRQIAVAIWKNFPNKFSKVRFLSNLADIFYTSFYFQIVGL
jgi:hypothetical protein